LSYTEILAIILGGGSVAAIVSGFMQLVLWKLNRKAHIEDKLDNANKHIEQALKAMLHDRIKWLGKTYITNGYISTEDLRDIIDMHVCYHDMRGNGLLDNIMRQVQALPIRK
jgi:hypothetical protein